MAAWTGRWMPFRAPIRAWCAQAPGTGLVAALNADIAAARGPWIARMDADDIALPQRLAVQLDWCARHPELDVCGAQFELEACYSRPGVAWSRSTSLQTKHLMYCISFI